MTYYWILNIICIILVSYYIGRWEGKRDQHLNRIVALEAMAHPWNPDAEGQITDLNNRVQKLEGKAI